MQKDFVLEKAQKNRDFTQKMMAEWWSFLIFLGFHQQDWWDFMGRFHAELMDWNTSGIMEVLVGKSLS